MAETGYINGSDLLLSIGGKPVGHCTSHKLTFNTETKDRAVKPLATQGSKAGLWKEKGVNGLSITISPRACASTPKRRAALPKYQPCGAPAQAWR